MRSVFTLLCAAVLSLAVRSEDMTYRVHLVENIEVDGVIVETVDEIQYTGTGFTTAYAGDRAGMIFCGWKTNTKQDSDSGFAARDYWGRAYEQISFTLYEPMTNTAVYVSADRDSDHDGMPDGTELYWYGDLDETPDSDSDGDGIGFADELERGLNPHFADEWKGGNLTCVSRSLASHRLYVRCDPANVLFADFARDMVENERYVSEKLDPDETPFTHWELDGVKQVSGSGSPLTRVSLQMGDHDIELVAVCQTYQLILKSDPEGLLFATTTNRLMKGEAVATSSYNSRSSAFGYWAVNGVRQKDGFGRAIDQVSFAMPAQDVEIVAVCSQDAMEREGLYWFGDRTVSPDSDADHDGLTMREERELGLNPLFADKWVSGIRTVSGKPQFFKLTLRSEPEGLLFKTVVEDVCPGVSKSTATFNPSSSMFTHWTIKGVSQRDDFGRALDAVAFEMPAEDVEVVAHCATDEAVRQSVYWYGNETTALTDDTDGDGLTLREELAIGTNPLFADAWQRGIVSVSEKPQFFKYTLKSDPEGVLFATTVESVCPGVVKTTAGYSPMTSQFAYWTVGGVCQRDDFGRALDAVSVVMPTNDIVVVAHCAENAETRQALYWYGDETTGWESDTDGDGYTLKEELTLGLNPLFADSWQRGVESAVTGFELFTCIIRSEPEGRLFATRKLNLGPGVIVSTDAYNPSHSTFAQWTLNGVRQADEFGRALDSFSFTMPATDAEAVAWCKDDEQVRQSYYWYGREMSDSSDTDGDGFTFAEERLMGLNPLFADRYTGHGVNFALSEELEVDLQPFEQMRGTIVDGDYEELFTSPLAGNGGTSTTFAPNACPLASDIDGDGLFDLVVVAKGQVRLFVNRGSAANPDFSEVSLETGVWSVFASVVATMTHPVVCCDKGVLYVSDRGGEIYAFTIADGAIVNTGLVGIPGILDGMLVALNGQGVLVSAGSKPVCTLDTPVLDGLSIAFSDIDADGRTDFLASDADGHIWLYRNASTANNLLYGRYAFVLKHKVWAGTGVGFAEGMTISLVDWEDDGDQDVVIGTASGKLMLLRDPRTGRPTNVRAYPGVDNVLLEWDPNEQPRIRGYNVYRAPVGFEYSRIANQIPLPTYRDMPGVLQDYWYRITGVSRFYIAGNSTPTVYESMPTDAVYVQFRPSVWLNDTSSFTDTNVEVIVSMNNSMGLSSDGFSMTFAYDPAVLEPVEMKTTGLTEELEFEEEVEKVGGGGQWRLISSDGKIGTGAGRFLRLVFYVKPVHDVKETTVSAVAASVKATDGRAVTLELPKSAKIAISDSHPIVPAIVSVEVADAAVETETEFELDVTVKSTETLTNFTANVAYDERLLELRGVSGAARLESAPYRVVSSGAGFALRFYAKDPESVLTNLSTVVALTNIVAVDCHGFAVKAADASGTVLLKNVHPWVPATVGVNVASAKVDTLTEFELPVKVTSNQTLTRFEATVVWDGDVLEWRDAEGVAVRSGGTPDSTGTVLVGAGNDFKLRFYAKNQHATTKTRVRLTNMTAIDVHGLTADPIADAAGDVLIHDAQPLVPAEVTIRAQDTSVKTRQNVTVPISVTSTKTLTALSVKVGFDAAVLEYKGCTGGTWNNGVISVSGSVPSVINVTFYAKEQHTVTRTTITLSEGRATCIEGLAANVSAMSGTVSITDSNPPVAPNAIIGTRSVRVTSGETFRLPVGRTSDADMKDYTATISWDPALTFKGAETATSTKTHSATSATFSFATSGTLSTDYLTFAAPVISGLQESSWVKISAAGGTGANGLAAKITSSYPITSPVLIVREIGRYSPGDINGDGKLTDADKELLENYIKYQSIVAAAPQLASRYASWKLTGSALKAADVNSDGKVDASDLSLLVQWIAEYKELYE